MLPVIRPSRLLPGDTIGITAPAGWGDPEGLKPVIARFEQMGLKVKVGDTVYKRYGYLAGTDAERATELNEMFADPGIQAIVCSRGGYGTARIADMLNYEMIRRNPKIFWGYSDITFLHNAIRRHSGLVTFHGPMPVSLAEGDVHPLTLEGFSLLREPRPFGYDETITPLQVLVPGEARGRIAGGNLTLLASTLGTPYELDTKGCILFIEDIDEEPYRIDRMLNQLRQAGKLAEAAGFMICDFHQCEPKKRQNSFTLTEVLEHYFKAEGKPALAGFGIGHGTPNIAIPVGIEAIMNTDKRQVACVEPAVLG
ncbi:S66 peptidase family protein [Paenibacillus jiagnxiensis]|uniref:S66 peptidase family protein n=1 Tax=Paenibacillus jiagnxiensis TaxID=3228926 RepID=UPI0033BFA06B